MAKKKTKKANPKTVTKKAVAKKEAVDKQVEADKAAVVKAAEDKQKAADKKKADAEKKAKEEAVPKKVTRSVTPAKINIAEVDKVKVMLADYGTTAPRGAATPAKRKIALDKLVKVITFLSSHPRKEVLDEFYVFFKKERLGLMAEITVFQAITTLNATTRERVELLYGAMVITMSNVTAKKKIRPNIKLLTKRFGDGVSGWFAAKSK